MMWNRNRAKISKHWSLWHGGSSFLLLCENGRRILENTKPFDSIWTQIQSCFRQCKTLRATDTWGKSFSVSFSVSVFFLVIPCLLILLFNCQGGHMCQWQLCSALKTLKSKVCLLVTLGLRMSPIDLSWTAKKETQHDINIHLVRK